MSSPTMSVPLDQLAAWSSPRRRLAGDQRTETLLRGVLAGILGSGHLVCRQIAAFPPLLAASAHADRRSRRMLTGDTTRRSELEPEAIFAALREIGLARLRESDHLWLGLDGSDLRKPPCPLHGSPPTRAAAGGRWPDSRLPTPDRARPGR